MGHIPAWRSRIVSFPFMHGFPTGNSPPAGAAWDGGWQPVIPPEKVDRLRLDR